MATIDGLKLDGIIEMADGETVDGLFDAFTDFLESRKCYYHGAYRGVDLDEVDDSGPAPQIPEPLNPLLEADIREKLRQLNEGEIEVNHLTVRSMFLGQTQPYVVVDFKKQDDNTWYCDTYVLPPQTPEAHG